MIILDASVLVAHLSSADAHHDAATNLLLEASDELLLAHPLTLAEVLVGGVRVGRAIEMWADLQSAGVHLASRDDGEPLRLAHLRASTALKLSDCCVVDAARTNDGSVATFDRTLASTASRLGLTVRPAGVGGE